MNWPALFAVLAVAVPPLAQKSSVDALKGREITLRACIEQGIGNAVILAKVTDVTEGDGAATPTIRAKRILYWFYEPAEFRDRAGQVIEVKASVKEATAASEEELTLTAFDVVGEPERCRSARPAPAISPTRSR